MAAVWIRSPAAQCKQLRFDDSDVLYSVSRNTAFSALDGPKVDEITDFASGTDTLEFVSSAFGHGDRRTHQRRQLLDDRRQL